MTSRVRDTTFDPARVLAARVVPEVDVVELLRRADVMKILGVKRTKFAQMIANGELPEAVIVSGKIKAWRSDEIDYFIKTRPRVRSVEQQESD